MTAPTLSQFTLTPDELHVAGSRIGVQNFPTVLGLRSLHSTLDSRDAAYDRATRALTARGLIVDGGLDADLAPMLHVLQRPDRELAMRLVTPDGMARVCVARRGSLCMLARRVADEVVLRPVGYNPELRDAVAALLAELPRSAPAEITPVGAPLEAVAEQLSGTHDGAALADRIRALGVEPRAAMLLGSALASRQAFAEIVYYTLISEEGRIARHPAAVGVYYTKRGRIVGAPSASPAGQLWTTVKPGSDRAFHQAIAQLVEISDEGWGGL